MPALPREDRPGPIVGLGQKRRGVFMGSVHGQHSEGSERADARAQGGLLGRSATWGGANRAGRTLDGASVTAEEAGAVGVGVPALEGEDEGPAREWWALPLARGSHPALPLAGCAPGPLLSAEWRHSFPVLIRDNAVCCINGPKHRHEGNKVCVGSEGTAWHVGGHPTVSAYSFHRLRSCLSHL